MYYLDFKLEDNTLDVSMETLDDMVFFDLGLLEKFLRETFNLNNKKIKLKKIIIEKPIGTIVIHFTFKVIEKNQKR